MGVGPMSNQRVPALGTSAIPYDKTYAVLVVTKYLYLAWPKKFVPSRLGIRRERFVAVASQHRRRAFRLLARARWRDERGLFPPCVRTGRLLSLATYFPHNGGGGKHHPYGSRLESQLTAGVAGRAQRAVSCQVSVDRTLGEQALCGMAGSSPGLGPRPCTGGAGHGTRKPPVENTHPRGNIKVRSRRRHTSVRGGERAISSPSASPPRLAGLGPTHRGALSTQRQYT
jgi:hypothetical protein